MAEQYVMKGGKLVPAGGSTFVMTADGLVPADEEETTYGAEEAASDLYRLLVKGPSNLPLNIGKGLDMLTGETDTAEYMKAREERMDEQLAPTPYGDEIEMLGEVVAGGPGGGVRAGTGKFGRDVAARVGDTAAEAAMYGAAMGGDPGTDAALGAGIATGFELPGIAGKAVNKVGNATKRLLPAIARKLTPMSDEARAADQFATERGIPVAGEDLIQNNLIRSTGQAVDYMDPTNFRNRQIQSMEENFQREIMDPHTTYDSAIEVLGEGFTKKYDELKATQGKMYDAAFAELNPRGDVPVAQFRTNLGGMRQKVARELGEDSAEVKAIDKWMGYADGNLETWANRRKKLSRTIRKIQRSADPDTVEASTLYDIADELDLSLDRFAGADSKWRQANDFHKQNMVPYKQEAFGKAIRKGEIEKVVKDALSDSPTAGTDKRFKEAWKALDPQGQAAYRQAVLEKIMEEAKNPETGFSPARAKTMIERMQNRLGPEVLGDDLVKALDGYRNLFEVSGFAGEQVARSRTGASVPRIAGAATAFGGLAMGILPPELLMTVVPALMVRSKRFRDMLAKLADMPANHPDREFVMNQITEEVLAEAGKAGGTGAARVTEE